MSGEGLDLSPWYGDAVNLSPCWHGIWTDHLHRAPEPHLIGILPEQGYWLHSMWYILPLGDHHDGFIIEAPSINHDGHVASLVTHWFLDWQDSQAYSIAKSDDRTFDPPPHHHGFRPPWQEEPGAMEARSGK